MDKINATGYHTKDLKAFSEARNQLILVELDKETKIVSAILFAQLFESLGRSGDLLRKSLLTCWNINNKSRFLILISERGRR